MAITSSAFAKALWPGINTWYGAEYNEWKPEYPALFDEFTSTKQFEEDVGTTGFGLPGTKAEGESITYQTESQAFITRYTHTVYGTGFIITRELVEDDQYNMVGQRRSKGLAFVMRQGQEVLAANIYNNAFTSGTGGDGSFMCVTNHSNFSGGTWSNTLTTAANLSESALEQACIDIMNFTNDRGRAISVMPQSLIIPTELTFDAQRILYSTKRVGSSDNDLNALDSLGYFPKGIVVNHYLTDTNAWFIRTNVKHGTKRWVRRKMEFGVDNDFDTENAKFKATERVSYGWTDPRGVYGTAGA
jgi:hypothetical protein